MRYERKFYTQHLDLTTLENLILRHPLSFRAIFPKRQVNNIYFDTHSWITYFENLAGISDRTKYRLRWYGSDISTIKNAQFELKNKQNLLGSKTIYPLKDPVQWTSVAQVLLGIPQIEHLDLFPVLVNSYERYYYQSADQHFRLTVDCNLRCAPYQTQMVKQSNFSQAIYVIELKYEQGDDDRLDEFTQYWPLRNARFSKYVNGMQLIFQ